MRFVRPIVATLRRGRHAGHALPDAVRFGDLRRLTPVSRSFGYDRGTPVDRYYIEQFLARHSDHVRGRTLEIGDDSYTRQFGGDRVTKADILHISPDNPKATIVGDLSQADHIPSNTFDCIILTQTLHLIYDIHDATRTLYRILAPSGVLLLTVPGITQISHDEWNKHWFWSFTDQSVRRLFGSVFSPPFVDVETHGNVLASIAFLMGLAAGELRQEELQFHDPHYQLLIALKAVKCVDAT